MRDYNCGDRVEIIIDSDFKGWQGEVVGFEGRLVCVFLDQPPSWLPPQTRDGRKFHPMQLRKVT